MRKVVLAVLILVGPVLAESATEKAQKDVAEKAQKDVVKMVDKVLAFADVSGIFRSIDGGKGLLEEPFEVEFPGNESSVLLYGLWCVEMKKRLGDPYDTKTNRPLKENTDIFKDKIDITMYWKKSNYRIGIFLIHKRKSQYPAMKVEVRRITD